MKAKHVSGNLRTILDRRASRVGYESWGDFITQLHLQDEQLHEVIAVLRDMEDGDPDTIGKGGD